MKHRITPICMAICRRVLLAVMVVAAVVSGSTTPGTVAAQQVFDIGQMARQMVEQAEALANSEQTPATPAHLIQQRFMIDDDGLESWLFNGQDMHAVRRKLESEVASQILALDRECGLDTIQKAKLEAAGHGDIAYLWDDVERLRIELRQGLQNPNAMNDLMMKVQPIQAKLQASFLNGDSRFKRVLPRVLTDEQLAKYEALEEDNRRFAYRAIVKMAVRAIEKSVPLSADQRDRLVERLSQTEPAAREGQYAVFYVTLQAAELADELDQILNEQQRVAIRKIYDQAKQMEPFLRQNGLMIP